MKKKEANKWRTNFICDGKVLSRAGTGSTGSSGGVGRPPVLVEQTKQVGGPAGPGPDLVRTGSSGSYHSVVEEHLVHFQAAKDKRD